MKDIYTIMNRQNILNFYGSKLDLKLDSSELYDYQLTKNDVDYDVNLLNTDIPLTFDSLIIESSCFDNISFPLNITVNEDIISDNCEFNVRRRTEKGWTLDFIFNRDTLNWSDGKVFYYLGSNENYIDKNYLDNNLSFKFTSDGKIRWDAFHYSGICNTVSGYTSSRYQTTGTTSPLCVSDDTKDFNLTIVFDRYTEFYNCDLENEGGVNDLIQGPHSVPYSGSSSGTTTTQIVTGYTITNDIDDWLTGGTITTEYIEELNKKWAFERDKRLGDLKIYLNGNLIHIESNWEEIIPSYRDNIGIKQVWGGGTNLNFNEHNGNCEFIIKSIKYYEEPLNFLQIRHNFNIIKSDYDFEICGPVCVDTVIIPTPTPTPTPTPVPTNTPSPTPTNAPTFTPTPTITPTPGPTDTPTPTPTPFITPTPYPFTTQPPGGFTFDADYIIVSYAFTDGADLDTRTRISSPNIGQNNAQSYLGWCRSTAYPDPENGGTPILTWSGDNTGQGFESVFVNLIEFKNQYPSETSLTIEMSAMWYGDLGNNPVIMDVMLYKGGTVTLVESDYLFINEGYSGIYGVASEGTIVTLQSQECFDQQLVAKLQYNLTTYNGQFI